MTRRPHHRRDRLHRGRLCVGVAAVLALAPVALAQDAVITVTRTDDPASDGCRPDDCSLREAVGAAYVRPGPDVIVAPAGVFVLRQLGPLSVTGQLVLRGAGQERTVIDLSEQPAFTTGPDTVEVGPGVRAEDADLTLEDLTVRGAQTGSEGAVAAVESALTLRSVAVTDNRSGSVGVGNHRTGRPLVVEDSVFARNAGSGVRYFGPYQPSAPLAVQVRRSVFRDNGGPLAAALRLFVPPGDSPGHDRYQAVVEDSVFHANRQAIDGTGSIRVSRSSFVGNSSVTGGAMHFNAAAQPVLLEQVLVESNTATNDGGGIDADNLVVRDSVFRGNDAGIDGGAIEMIDRGPTSPELQVTGSVFANNSASRGGAIGQLGGAARLANVTLSGNVARDARLGNRSEDRGGEGAALYLGTESATATLRHATVVGNRGRFGALYTLGRLELAGSVLADTATLDGSAAPNCGVEGGAVVSDMFNLADDDSCGLDAFGDRVGDPGLGLLMSTGGTFAHLPLAGSLLVDGAGRVCPLADQRGVARPVDGDGDGEARCDIGAVEALSGRVRRVSGLDRVATAVEVSQALVGDQQAGVVVLARSDGFADGLAGGPLAAAGDGPLLLTGRDGLDPLAAEELARVLPTGGEVVLLGGPAALRTAVEERVAELGFRPVRVAGADRYATAVAVARRLGDPSLLLLASGTDFPDALSAGAAAATAGGAVLLTAGDQLPAPTRAYLDDRPDAERVAVGGPAAAADPGAEPVVGPDRYATAVAVARRFHDQPAGVGVASGQDFPDALAAGPDSARRGGPLLLSPPDRLPDLVADYLAEIAPTLTDTTGRVRIYGGENAVSLQVEADLDAVVRP